MIGGSNVDFIATAESIVVSTVINSKQIQLDIIEFTQTDRQTKIFLNSFHPDIGIHIFLSVLNEFPTLLTRRISSAMKSFFSW